MTMTVSEPSSRPKYPEPKNETVIIVHGILMQGFLMQVLAWRLRRLGYKTRCVSYRFLRQTPEQNSQVLLDALNEVNTPTVHWAAHSLGGIVWLHAVNSGAPFPPGRTVLIGSPVQGSRIAGRIYRLRWLRWLLGHSVKDGLLGGAPQSVGSQPVGLIRGGGWLSLSRWLLGSPEPSDGVVLHSETELDGVTHITQVPRSHTVMVFSGLTARKAAEFFAKGEFSNTG